MTTITVNLWLLEHRHIIPNKMVVLDPILIYRCAKLPSNTFWLYLKLATVNRRGLCVWYPRALRRANGEWWVVSGEARLGLTPQATRPRPRPSPARATVAARPPGTCSVRASPTNRDWKPHHPCVNTFTTSLLINASPSKNAGIMSFQNVLSKNMYGK